jgi:DNA (cytosine-5)-methyltransferase 1
MNPDYVIPTMAEVAEVKNTNGYKMISTFSGCGGSCLGFEMAGYEILWANEFVPEARATYELNHDNVILNPQDIREITAEQLLDEIGMKAGELDLFEGSPPCSSFSMAGSREKAWGKDKKYSDTNQRADDLFFEYSRLIKGVQPKVFIAENVTGLVKGKAIGYFKEIVAELESAGYIVSAKILDASWLGVPQARQRLIIIGVRNDLAERYGVTPAFPTPLQKRFVLKDIIDVKAEQITHDPETGFDITLDRYAVGAQWDRLQTGEQSEKYFQLVKPSLDKPVGTITATGGIVGAASVTHPLQKRKFTLIELRALSSFPADFVLTGTFPQRWERIGRSVPPLMAKAIGDAIRYNILDKLR